MNNKQLDNSINGDDLRIRWPLFWLALAAVAVYGQSFFYGLTKLDDYNFIFKWDKYNEHLSALLTCFRHPVFALNQGHFYRPIFVDTIILNYQLCGKNVAGYHVVNVCLHILAVSLLYKLYVRLRIKQMTAFVLCLLFAVHPALCQAVAWIPGRNDVLLAIFVLSFLIFSINYSNTGKPKQLVLATLFLLLSCFTKEAGIFATAVAWVLLVVILNKNWRDPKLLNQYAIWMVCVALWVAARSAAHVTVALGAPKVIVYNFLANTPVILQYLGKLLLPFNLSVYPSLHSTCVYGFVALALMVSGIYLAKGKSERMIFGGIAVFSIFLTPALLLPRVMSQQPFEHRLYLPAIGFLLLLPQTVLFKNTWSRKKVLIIFLSVTIVMAGINCNHERSFANSPAFWRQAMVSTPRSVHAIMVVALDEKDFAASYRLFMSAYAIDPKEKFLNFCRGVKLQREDSVLASEPYLLAEKQLSHYYECDYYLARVAVKKGDYAGAVALLQAYIARDPDNATHTNTTINNAAWLNAAAARAYAKRLSPSGIATDILDQLGVPKE